MFFPGVGDVPVRYFFTDKPYLPFPSVYGSNNWIRDLPVDADGEDDEAGERWTVPRPWRNGAPPLECDCTYPQGSLDAWMGLSDSTSPLFQCPGWGFAYDEEYDEEYDSQTFAEG